MPGLLGILGENMDLLGKLLTLLESYLLLDAGSIIQVSDDVQCPVCTDEIPIDASHSDPPFAQHSQKPSRPPNQIQPRYNPFYQPSPS